MAQCSDRNQWQVVPLGSMFGSVFFHVFFSDIVGLSAPSVSLQKTSSLVVQVTHLRDRMPFKTLRGQVGSGETI